MMLAGPFMLLMILLLIVCVCNAGYLWSTARFVRALAEAGGTIDGHRVEGSIFSRSDRSLLLKAYLTGGKIEPVTAGHRDAIVRARWLMVASLFAFAGFVYLLQATPTR